MNLSQNWLRSLLNWSGSCRRSTSDPHSGSPSQSQLTLHRILFLTLPTQLTICKTFRTIDTQMSRSTRNLCLPMVSLGALRSIPMVMAQMLRVTISLCFLRCRKALPPKHRSTNIVSRWSGSQAGKSRENFSRNLRLVNVGAIIDSTELIFWSRNNTWAMTTLCSWNFLWEHQILLNTALISKPTFSRWRGKSKCKMLSWGHLGSTWVRQSNDRIL